MEFFDKANAVRLRSRHGKYLWAEEDECMVSQRKDAGRKPNSVWTIEIDAGNSALRLKSCYDCYLTATGVPYLLGMTGKKVLQMKLKDSDSSIVWEPVREGFSVKMKTPHGNYLRANGSIPPWRNSVTHDTPHRTATHDWILWEVEATETLPNSVSLNNASFNHASFNHASFKEVASSPKPSPKPHTDGRIIHYSVADDDGECPDEFESQFVFKGFDLRTLTEKMKEETGIDEEIIICSRNHINNKLYELRLQLPPNNTPMYLVVVKASSRIGQTLLEMVESPGQNVSKQYSKSFGYSLSLNDD